MSEGGSANVRVVVRVRPLLRGVDDPADQPCRLLDVRPPATVAVDQHQYRLDGVLDGSARQADVYAAVGLDGMLECVVDGFNATLFAYGQTGSGKTFSMDGLKYDIDRHGRVRIEGTAGEEEGLTLRAIDALFDKLSRRRSRKTEHDGVQQEQDDDNDNDNEEVISVRSSFVQIYEEKVYDLLCVDGRSAKRRKPLAVRWNRSLGFHTPDVYVLPCTDAEAARSLYQLGVRARTVASHRLNATSSRSHSVFTLRVERRTGSEAVPATTGCVHFVDLAGSERLKSTQSTGRVRDQGIQINRSLFALRQVIKALVSRDTHVPYRDSTLTRLLMTALGGNSLTVMLACCAPGDKHVQENISTLDYASLVRRVTNRAVVNEDPLRRLIRRLRAQVQDLKACLALLSSSTSAAGGGGVGRVSSEVEEKFVAAVEVMRRMHMQLTDADEAHEALEAENAQLQRENSALRDRALFLEELVGEDRAVADVEEENRELRSMLVTHKLQIKQLLSRAPPSAPVQAPHAPKEARPNTARLRPVRDDDRYSAASRKEHLWFRPTDSYVSAAPRKTTPTTGTGRRKKVGSAQSRAKKNRRELLRALMSRTSIRKPY